MKLTVYYFSLLILFQAIGIFFILRFLKTHPIWAIVLTVFIASILPILLGLFVIKMIKKAREEGE